MRTEQFNFYGQIITTCKDGLNIFIDLDKLNRITLLPTPEEAPTIEIEGVNFIDIQHLELYWLRYLDCECGVCANYRTYFIDELVKFWTLQMEDHPHLIAFTQSPFSVIKYKDHTKSLFFTGCFGKELPDLTYLEALSKFNTSFHHVQTHDISTGTMSLEVRRVASVEDADDILRAFLNV